jgi:hypothetical protein
VVGAAVCLPSLFHWIPPVLLEPTLTIVPMASAAGPTAAVYRHRSISAAKIHARQQHFHGLVLISITRSQGSLRLLPAETHFNQTVGHSSRKVSGNAASKAAIERVVVTASVARVNRATETQSQLRRSLLQLAL